MYCKSCGKKIKSRKGKRGRPRQFCDAACKQKNYRFGSKVRPGVLNADVMMSMQVPEFEASFNAIMNGCAPYRTKSGSIVGTRKAQH